MMRTDKKKLVFGIVVLMIILFIGVYGYMLFETESEDSQFRKQPDIPELQENQREYNNRKEAVDNLKEDRNHVAPSLYNEKLIDESGNYNPYLEEKQKIKLMDSILASGPEPDEYGPESNIFRSERQQDTIKLNPLIKSPIKAVIEIGQGHKSFFHPVVQKQGYAKPGFQVRAEVSGDQVIQQDQRLELRLLDDFVQGNDTLPKNRIIFANCSFKPNRLLLTIYPTDDLKLSLRAYDILDGREGIYIRNSFRSQATSEVIDDLIQDINISGVPQVSGLKNIFQRSNRNIKVKVLHQYQLILKP